MEENKTLEQRALDKFPPHADIEFEVQVLIPQRKFYVETAKEQQEIDIERMTKWIKRNLSRVIPCYHGEIDIVERLKEDILDDLIKYVRE